MRKIVVVALVSMLLTGACTRRDTIGAEGPKPTPTTPPTAGPATTAAPVASASASAAPSAPPPPPPEAQKVAAWTDPEVVADLMKSCKWKPAKASNEADIDPLACEADMFDQSCVYDPCFYGVRQECREKCVRTCNSCGDGCAAKCETCKSSCKDDACREACAKQCGACHQDCLKAKDNCATATCNGVYEACDKSNRAKFTQSGCKKHCHPYESCFADCFNGPEAARDKCLAACRKPLPAVCTQEMMRLCELYGYEAP